MMKRIYLDYNASSILYPEVSDLMIKILQDSRPANASSIHHDGRKARSVLEAARLEIAESLVINLNKDDLQIIFTSSGTEANNLIISNYLNIPLFAGATEHVSVLEAGHQNLQLIPVDQNGVIDPAIFARMLNDYQGRKLVSIMLANNETGVIQDIKLLAEIAHKANAVFHCDASQAFGKIPVNFKDLAVDSMMLSSHKCGGPVGAAALICKKSLHLNSMIKGGKQELGLRSGTENLLAIAGFGLAAKISLGHFAMTQTLRDYLEQEISKISPEVIFFGDHATRTPNTSSIRMPDIKNEEQLIKFDLNNISVSAGSACSSGRIASSHVLKAMHIAENIANQTIRVSIGPSTTKSDIDAFIAQWKEIYNHGH